MNETVSIIIPTRNRCAVLARCLAALPAGVAGLVPPEVIVVDDCSSDQTSRIVAEFASTSGWQIVFRRQECALGANAARNEAVKIARGGIIVFIDDDVLVTPGWLPSLIGGLSNQVSVVAGSVRLTVEGTLVGKHREEVSSFFAEVLAPPLGLEGDVVPVLCNMAVLRRVFDRAVFDEIVQPPVEEVDWLRRAGVSAAFNPEALVWHYKTAEDIQLKRVLRLAWVRGSEGGWWIRECAGVPSGERRRMAARCLSTSARALGHAVIRRCWGGMIVSVGELSKALAVTGVINRGSRTPKSWI